MLNKDGSSIYDHFNRTDPVSIPLDLDRFAAMIHDNNYAIVRLFAAIIRQRRNRFADLRANYLQRGDHDIVRNMDLKGDAVEQALVRLLVNDEH